MDSMTTPSIISFDVETTGLWATDCHIIELAAVRWENGAPVARFESFVNPGRPIDPASTAVHGITDADVAAAPRMAEVLERFFAFAGNTPLAAHNAPFDLGFLAVECARNGRALPAVAAADTLTLAKAAFKGLPSYRLSSLADALAIEAATYHRALADAETAGALFWKAFGALGEIPESAWVTVRDVVLAADDALGAALAAGQPFEIEYGKFARRFRIRPLTVFGVQRTGYLHAHCPELGADRTFRLDWVRVRQATAAA